MPVHHWAADWHSSWGSLRVQGGKSRKGDKEERKGDGGGGEGRW